MILDDDNSNFTHLPILFLHEKCRSFLHFYTGRSSPEVPCPVLPAIGQPISGNGEEARHLARSGGAVQTYRKRSKTVKTWEKDGNPDITAHFFYLLFMGIFRGGCRSPMRKTLIFRPWHMWNLPFRKNGSLAAQVTWGPSLGMLSIWTGLSWVEHTNTLYKILRNTYVSGSYHAPTSVVSTVPK